MATSSPIELLIIDSGAPADARFVRMIQDCLRRLRDAGEIDIVRLLTATTAGLPVGVSMRERLDYAQIVLVLVSHDLDLELLRKAKQGASAGMFVTLIVRARAVEPAIEAEFEGLTVVPESVPLSTSPDPDAELVKVSEWTSRTVRGIRHPHDAARRRPSDAAAVEVSRTRARRLISGAAGILTVLVATGAWLVCAPIPHADVIVIGGTRDLCQQLQADAELGAPPKCVWRSRWQYSPARKLAAAADLVVIRDDGRTWALELDTAFASAHSLPHEPITLPRHSDNQAYLLKLVHALHALHEVRLASDAMQLSPIPEHSQIGATAYVLAVSLDQLGWNPATEARSPVPASVRESVADIARHCFDNQVPLDWTCVRAATLTQDCKAPVNLEKLANVPSANRRYPRLHDIAESTWLECQCRTQPSADLARRIVAFVARQRGFCDRLILTPIVACMLTKPEHIDAITWPKLLELWESLWLATIQFEAGVQSCDPLILARVFDETGRVFLEYARELSKQAEHSRDHEQRNSLLAQRNTALDRARRMFARAHESYTARTNGRLSSAHVLNWAEASLLLGELDAPLASREGDKGVLERLLSEPGASDETRLLAALFLWLGAGPTDKQHYADKLVAVFERVEVVPNGDWDPPPPHLRELCCREAAPGKCACEYFTSVSAAPADVLDDFSCRVGSRRCGEPP